MPPKPTKAAPERRRVVAETVASDLNAAALERLQVGVELHQHRIDVDATHAGGATHRGFEDFELAHDVPCSDRFHARAERDLGA